ncbi:MAG: TolC family protein [Paramuribaculum sp.]|nr:TolC family protein [Paramuribaculum sp.]
MIRRFIFATAIILCIADSAYAADYINNKAKEIASSSPALRAFLNTQKAQISELKADNILENPEVSFSHLWGQGGIGNKYTIGISQNFDWPGVYSARKKVISARQKVLSDYAMVKTAEIFLAAKEAMIDAVYAKRLIALRSVVYKQVDSLYNAYKKARLTGDITVLDLNRAVIERSMASRNLREAEVMLIEAGDKIRAINVGCNVESVMAGIEYYPVVKVRSEEEYAERLVNMNPLLLAAKSEVEISEFQQTLASASRYPGFSIGYEHEYEMGERFNGLSVSMTLPIYSRKNTVQTADYNKIAAEESLTELNASLVAEYNTLRHKVISAQSDIETYGKIFSGYENLDMLQRLFQSGQINLTEYITELTYFVDAQIEYESFIHTMHLDAANLNKFIDLVD